MNFSRLIPALDPAPLPGPPWLFHLLWLITFAAHLLCVNAVLGGSFLGLIALLQKDLPGRRETTGFFVTLNGWAISFAVTMGIAPLLFIQVLLGPFFYSATILLAWAWLGLLALLTVAYYLNYWAKSRLYKGQDIRFVLGVQVILFLVIAGIQVAVNLTHLQPEGWSRVSAHPWSVLLDPAFFPRYLHFVLAATAVSGVILAFWSVRDATGAGDRALAEAKARFGVRAALIATILQVAAGFALLLTLPRGVMLSLVRGGGLTWLLLGVLAGIGTLVALGLAWEPLARPRLTRHIAALITGAMVFMIITRHQVRGLYLASTRGAEKPKVATQWDVLLLFLALLVVAIAVTAYAMVRSRRDRVDPGEPAA
jgi:amino acid transporter